MLSLEGKYGIVKSQGVFKSWLFERGWEVNEMPCLRLLLIAYHFCDFCAIQAVDFQEILSLNAHKA